MQRNRGLLLDWNVLVLEDTWFQGFLVYSFLLLIFYQVGINGSYSYQNFVGSFASCYMLNLLIQTPSSSLLYSQLSLSLSLSLSHYLSLLLIFYQVGIDGSYSYQNFVGLFASCYMLNLLIHTPSSSLQYSQLSLSALHLLSSRNWWFIFISKLCRIVCIMLYVKSSHPYSIFIPSILTTISLCSSFTIK